jgi:Flp pilus assembly protein TadG
MNRLNAPLSLRQRKGAAILEFALVVPIPFMMVWGIISFSRAYQRMNALTAALREGARSASTMDSIRTVPNRTTSVKNTITNFSSAFGYTVDVTQVSVSTTANDVTVSVTNYPIFSGISFLGGLSSITITRQATFRCERNCND